MTPQTKRYTRSGFLKPYRDASDEAVIFDLYDMATRYKNNDFTDDCEKILGLKIMALRYEVTRRGIEMKLTSALPKKPKQRLISLEVEVKLYEEFRKKIKTQGVTLKDFFEAMVRLYLKEK